MALTSSVNTAQANPGLSRNGNAFPALPPTPFPDQSPNQPTSQPPKQPNAGALTALSRKGRGTVSNRSGRFESQARERLDDGWGSFDLLATESLKTTVTEETVRSAITYNQSPDLGFDRSINPYRGCEHGCVYCFARPTHAYLGLSPGQDFESRLFAKTNFVDALKADLRHKNYRPKPIAIGTNMDAYQPIEKQYRLLRSCLEVLSDANHPITITTKSAMVLRDLDILADMAKRDLVRVALSITTLDNDLHRRMEPRAAAPARRLDCLRQLKEAGIPTCVLVAPVIPGLTDSELERILSAAKDAGALKTGYILLRLPLEIQALFEEWLDNHYPTKARKVMRLVHDTHGNKLGNEITGKAYRSEFGLRMTGSGAYATMVMQRYKAAV